jgi:hypothetical protein
MGNDLKDDGIPVFF